MAWSIAQLNSSHDLAAFECGEPTLDAFLKKHALNNDRAGLGRTFVATTPGESRVVGYFAISTGSVRFDTVPDHTRKRLPKYPIPTVHLGRLAVDITCQRNGLGEALLVESLARAGNASEHVGVYAVDVIALNEPARRFYLKFGFAEMLDQPMHLFLPIATARRIALTVAEYATPAG